MADVDISKFRAQVVRDGFRPSNPGFVESEGQDPVNPPGTNNFVPYSGATDNVELGEFGLEAGFITLDTTPTNTPTAQGTMFWDADDETVDIILNGYTMKIGEDLFYPVKNQTGSTIAKGTAVRFNGTLGASGRLLIAPFIANGSVPSSRFMGVTAEEILNGEDGKVLYFGRIRGINTNAFNEGDILYASTTVAGGFQTAIPVAPNNIVQVAAVVTKSINQGTIFVRPTLGSSINKDEGVKITSVANLDLLQYQSGTALWENKTLAQVIGSAYVPSTRTLTINGTTQDLSADRTFNVGTVTSVSASSPLASSGGTTPNITIQQASGSQNGFLSSTDWNTFNSKQNALTNPVTGTGTTNYLPKFTGSTTIGNSQVFDNGSGVGIGGTNTDSLFTINGTAGTSHQRFREGSTTVGLVGGANGIITGQNGKLAVRAEAGLVLSSQGNSPDVLITSGNLLVGTTTDTGERLQVNGSGLFSSTVKINTSGVNTSLNAVSSGLQLVVDGSTGSNRNITFNIASTEAMRIDNNLNVVIGNTVASNVGLTIFGSNAATIYQTSNTGTGAGNGFYVGHTGDISYVWNYNNFPLVLATNNTERMRITSSGNLLVGTTSDNGARLQVSGAATFSSSVTANGNSASNSALIANNNGAGGTAQFYQDFGNGAGFIAGRILRGNGASGFVANGLNILSFDSFQISANATGGSGGSINLMSGNVGIGTPSPSAMLTLNGTTPFIRIERSGVPTWQIQNNFLSVQNGFSVNNITAGTTPFFIGENGNVGIGTTSPSALIHLASTTNPYLRIQNTTTTHNGYFGSTTNGIEIGTDSATAPINFYTGSVYTERMRITSSGNVLIGTTTDNGARLQVSGTGTFTSSVIAVSAGLNGSIANSGDAAILTIKQSSTSYNNGIYLERGGERNGYHIYIGGASDCLVFRRNYFGTQSDVMSLSREGNVLIGTTTNGASRLRIVGLPTSASGLSSGDVWNDGGTLKIA